MKFNAILICHLMRLWLCVTIAGTLGIASGLAFVGRHQVELGNAKAQSNSAPLVGKPIPNYYIVHLKPGARVDEFDDTLEEAMVQANTEKSTRNEPSNSLLHRYSQPNGFQGYAGRFNSAMIRRLQDSGQIESIEQDTIIHMADQQMAPLANWGLARISHHAKWQSNESFNYPASAGNDVDVWVLDTGVNEQLPDFEGRAHMKVSFIPGEPANDTNGHGTHVAGIVASKTYGVAKRANVYGIKVLNSYGDGRMSYLLSGIEYATKHARRNHTIINLSLSGGKSEALDKTVKAAYDAGIPVIVAAGNDEVDACDGSPSGTPTAFTVGAADNTDLIAEFSNYGACVRLFAPGVNIASWWIGTTPTTRVISGTSMAAPHAAGAAAILLGIAKTSNPEMIYQQLLDWATVDTVQRQPDDSTSPSRLLYIPSVISNISVVVPDTPTIASTFSIPNVTITTSSSLPTTTNTANLSATVLSTTASIRSSSTSIPEPAPSNIVNNASSASTAALQIQPTCHTLLPSSLLLSLFFVLI